MKHLDLIQKKEAKDFIRHNLDKNDKYVIKKYE